MSKPRHPAVRFLLQLIVALILGTVLAFAVTVPRAGWTSNDVTTGQSSGYPDLQTRRYDMAVDNTTTFAAEALRRTKGGHVLRTEVGAGHVVGEVRVTGTPFTDDIEVTVTPEEGHSVVNIRSHSRLGFADFGTNAAHIRAIQALMDDKLPRL